MMSYNFRRLSSYRCTVIAVVSLFFLNIILLFHVADVHLYVQQVVQEMKWTSGSRVEGTTRYTRSGSSCIIDDPMAVSALSRMQTESCRQKAKELICSLDQVTPASLPNSCPGYVDSQRGTYVGCFADNKFARVLTGHLYRLNATNSPQYCANLCMRAGYKYSGVEYREECFCGDSLRNASQLPDKACDRFTCPSNKTIACGGFEAVAVHTTGVIEKDVLKVDYMDPNGTLNSDVQILFLLQLNGRNIRQVMRMLKILYSPKHLYIVHVDSRQQFMYSEMVKFANRVTKEGLSNVYVMEKRYATIWAGASLLSMFLEAVRCATEDRGWNRWDFILNLSESDFPILSLNELEFHLARNRGRNFLSSHGYDTARFIRKQGLDFVFLECESRMWRLGKRAHFPSAIRLDGGSDWVTLSREFALFALTETPLVRGLRDIFANVLLPVESFFHTLSANSEFCNRTVKGNLHVTNWKRKQGCRCAMLRKVVDWCGCSPLVFRTSDITKFMLQTAKKKTTFFGRKFNSFLSQSAVEIAEKQALRGVPGLIDEHHSSYRRIWLNFFDHSIDSSESLTAWARAILERLSSSSPFDEKLKGCHFASLQSLNVYKESDDAVVQTIVDCEMQCEDNRQIRVEILVEPLGFANISEEAINDGYELVETAVGSDMELKEEVYRNRAAVLTTEDTITAKLRWRRVETTSSSVVANFSSPFVNVEWTDPTGQLCKSAKLVPYDSIYGSQFAELFPNDTMTGEWKVDFWSLDKRDETRNLLATMNFTIFPSDGTSFDSTLVEKYFKVIDICADDGCVDGMSSCSNTEWSHTSPDPKSEFNFTQLSAGS